MWRTARAVGTPALDHDVLRECLRRLDLGRGSRRAEDWETRVPEAVGDPRREGCFRPDDGDVGNLRFRHIEQRRDVGRVGLHAPAKLLDSRVPGRRDQIERLIVAGELPGERMLAPAAPDEQNLHFGRPRTAWVNASRARFSTSPTWSIACRACCS